ncbi:MAG: hypothetical protein JSR89_02210 [Proteobacteria bacterium]|nr:hypothetical protein [Pseudomonadota bacterium]
MDNAPKVIQYEKLVRQAANSLGIDTLEIAPSSILRHALHCSFKDTSGRRQEIFVPFRTNPSTIRATLRYLYGPKSAIVATR